MQPVIRPAQDSDGPALIALIWSCWSAYPNIKMDVDGEMPELRGLATYYAGQGGVVWVAEAAGLIAGMIAARPIGEGTWEICRVYVEPALHGSGLGHTLLDHAERHAIAAGAERLALWTDTRFDRAHRFYEKRSYVRHGAVRVLHDISNSLEFGYAKPVNGVETLDIAAAASAGRRLAAITAAGAASGANPPSDLARARAFWQQAANDVGAGKRVIVAGWRNGVLLGAGTLHLDMPDNQRHRAEVGNVSLDPDGYGVGRALIRGLEAASVAQDRTMLTVQTVSGTRLGDPMEALYQSEGWQEAGRIPDFARDASGRPQAAIIFWKTVAP